MTLAEWEAERKPGVVARLVSGVLTVAAYLIATAAVLVFGSMAAFLLYQIATTAALMDFVRGAVILGVLLAVIGVVAWAFHRIGEHRNGRTDD